MNTKTIKFDLNKYKLYEKIKAKQGDTKSRFLLFQLLDGSIPFNLTNRSVRAYMVKPDGKEIFNDLIINNYSLGYCTLELTNQVLAVSGTVKIELMVTEEDKKLTSSVFELEVVKSINSEKSIVSTNEFTALLNGLASLSEYDNYKNSVKSMEINKADKAKVEEKFGEVYEQLDTIAQQSTKFGNPTRAWAKSQKLNVYEAWPFTNGFYDLATNEICLAYNSKAYHTSKTGKVLFRKKNPLGIFGEAIEICDGYKCHACGINALGEYIAICQDITGEHGFDGGMCYTFKSTDKGKTWSNTGNLNVINVTVNEVEPVTGMKLMKDGTLYCFLRTYENNSYILKSTDNGVSWIASYIVLPFTNILLEGNFIELLDGTISCVVRGVLTEDNFTKHTPTYLINSFDKGTTWESKIELDIEASYNNVALLYHDDIKAIEMVYASRYKKNGNDNGAIYQAIVKEEDFKIGKIKNETKIMIGGVEGDFGYCELVKSNDNVVNCFFYIDETDGESGACIMEMVGTRNNPILQEEYDNNVIRLKTNAIDGNTPPSYFKELIKGEGTTFLCRVFNNTDGLPTTEKGTIYVDCFSYINGYNRERFYPALSQKIYERRDYENSDAWTDWIDITPVKNITMDTSLIINTPIEKYSFLKTPVTLFNSSSDTVDGQITIDTKNLFNNDWYNTYADGLKIEVLYKNVEDNTETQTISFNDSSFNTAYQRRIVCQHNFEQNYYIDTWVNSSTKELKVKIDKPTKVQTLIIRAVGVLFKQN